MLASDNASGSAHGMACDALPGCRPLYNCIIIIIIIIIIVIIIIIIRYFGAHLNALRGGTVYGRPEPFLIIITSTHAYCIYRQCSVSRVTLRYAIGTIIA